MPTSTPVTYLDPDRFEIFSRILKAVLLSKAAERTFAQIFDGLPVNDAYHYVTTRRLDLKDRKEPTDGSKVLFQGFVRRFMAGDLVTEAQVFLSIVQITFHIILAP
jgi:hypothetical protein